MTDRQTIPPLSPNALRLVESLLSLPRTWLTAATLASSVGISRRTVLRELGSIETWMTAAGFRFLRSPGQGLLLDEDAGSRDRIRQLLHSSAVPGTLPRQERWQQLMLSLLSAQEPTKSYALAHSLNISENTLSGDLDVVEDTLRPWEVSLRRRPGVGVWLEGAPEKRRRAAGALVKKQLFAPELQRMLRGEAAADSPLAQLLEPETTAAVWRLLGRFSREEGLQLTEQRLLSLTVHLSMTVSQLRRGCANSVCVAPTGDTGLACRLARQVSQTLQVELTTPEIGNLAMYLDAYETRPEPDSRELELRYLVSCLLQSVSQALGVELRAYPALSDGLCSHLRPMLLRLGSRMPVDNPQLAALQDQYPELWQATRLACDEACSAGLTAPIPDGEAGYLAMHIGAVLEQERMDRTALDAMIVCPYGVASSRFLAAQVTRDFPNIRIAGCCPAQSLDPAALRQQGIDLVISTVPLQIDFPHVRVDPILQEPDRALLRAAIDTVRIAAPVNRVPHRDRRTALRYTAQMSGEILDLLDTLTIFTLPSPAGKDGFLQAAAQLFCPQPAAAGTVLSQLRRRERMGNTYIEPLQALLLHCRTDAVGHCCLGYLRAEPAVMLEGQRVRGALVLLAPATGDVPLELMQGVSALLVEEPALIEALRNDDPAQASSLLEAGLSRRFRDALTMRL